MVNKNVVIVTDCKDIAIEQIKGRLIKILSKGVTSINFFYVFVPAFQINSGLFLSKLISEEIPHGKDTIFLAIVNPLKIKPKRIFGQLKNETWFVGADTGIFSLLFKEFGIRSVWETKDQCHYTFGGLHVHTVIAGNLLNKISKELIGNRISLENIKTLEPKKGEIVHIDNFGLIKIWSKIEDNNFDEDSKVNIKILNSKGQLIKNLKGVYSNRMMNYQDNCLIVYPGSSLLDKDKINDMEGYRKSGLIEIGLVRNSNGAKELGVKIGDVIKIE